MPGKHVVRAAKNHSRCPSCADYVLLDERRMDGVDFRVDISCAVCQVEIINLPVSRQELDLLEAARRIRLARGAEFLKLFRDELDRLTADDFKCS